MAESDVEICNMALRFLREQPITALTENTEPGKILNNIYDDSRDYLLARHPHNFALRRQLLAQLSTAPTYQYDYAYSLPTDPYCLRAYQLWHNGQHHLSGWVVEGRELLTDFDNDVYLRYITNEADVNSYAPTFVTALATYLAWRLAYPLSRSRRVQEEWSDNFKMAWKAHRMADGGEGFDEDDDEGIFVAIRY